MKKLVFSLLIFYISSFAKAQDFNQYSEVDRIALKLPDSEASSTEKIAAYIRSNFTTDLKKVRAIYTWVTANIRYDNDSSNVINLGSDPQAKITAALRRRRGVCENYAAIFNDLCLKSGLRSLVVSGYTKQSGVVDKTGHSWCVVYIDGKWCLFDPTWDEGRGTTSRYFILPPAEFILSHIPFDPVWQLLDYPVSHKQFYNGNFYRKKDDGEYFNYVDSINSYMQMDSLHKLQSSALRIQKMDLFNNLVKDNYNSVKMNIEMINQDKDVNLYNSSVADMNEATTILNSFIQYRNNQFTPEKTDAELQALLDGIDSKLRSALKKLDDIDRSPATFNIGTQHVRDRITTLMSRIKDQKDFLDKYIASAKASRQSLFYK